MRVHSLVPGQWVVAVALAISACGCVPAAANADLYWVGGATADRIGRASDEGSRIDRGLVSGLEDVGTLAVGDGYVYWTSGGVIGRAKLDGTNVERAFIRGLGPLNGVAVTGRYVYWLSDADPACGGKPGFGRATPNGGRIDQGFVCGGGRIADVDYANGVGVSGKYLYWSWINGIGRLDTSDGRFHNRFITLPRGFVAAGVSVGSGRVYWGSYSMGPVIGRANLDGKAVNPAFVSGLAGSIAPDIAVADGFLYFTNDYGSSATIARATLDGVVEWDFIIGFDFAGDLAVGPG